MKKDDFLDADKRRFYGLTLGKLVCVTGLPISFIKLLGINLSPFVRKSKKAIHYGLGYP